MSNRLHWILALVLALGPASLRLVHGAASHRAEPTTLAAHEGSDHHHDGEPDSAPAHDHHCGICDELASLSPDLPVPPAVPAFVPHHVATLRCVPTRSPATIVAPRICRGQPPPRA